MGVTGDVGLTADVGPAEGEVVGLTKGAKVGLTMGLLVGLGIVLPTVGVGYMLVAGYWLPTR